MGQGAPITQHRSQQQPGWARHLLHHHEELMWNCPGGEPTRVPPLTPDGEARTFLGCSALAQPSPHATPLFGPDPPWCIAHLQVFPWLLSLTNHISLGQLQGLWGHFHSCRASETPSLPALWPRDPAQSLPPARTEIILAPHHRTEEGASAPALS